MNSIKNKDLSHKRWNFDGPNIKKIIFRLTYEHSTLKHLREFES